MNIPPNFVPASADKFRSIIARLVECGGIRQMQRITSLDVPSCDWDYVSITLVPFLIVCLEGEIEVYTVDRKVVRLEERDALLFGPGSWPAVNHYGAPEYLRITFDTDYTLFGFESRRESQQPAPHKDLQLYLSRRLPGELGQRLLADLVAPDTDAFRRRHAGNLLLAEARGLLVDEPPGAGKAYHSWQQLRTYVHTHYDQPITRLDVAAALQITPTHVTRLVRQFADVAFNEYLENLRLDDAKAMLRSSALTIGEIADRCGFSSANYFMRVFRKRMGLSAGRYRSQG